ncbi:MAG: AMP-binding protein, partial [Planctomycetota bacterium]
MAETLEHARRRDPDKPALGVVSGEAIRWRPWSEVTAAVLQREVGVDLDAPGPVEVPTAGTSGASRRVQLSGTGLVANAVALSEVSAGGDELRLSFLPMEHLYARTCDLSTWIVRGSRLVLAESPKTVFRDAKLVRPTVINGVPYFFQKAIDLAERESVSLRTLLGGEIKRCYCGGAPLAPEVEQRFFDEGVPLYTGYGLTEASPVVSVNTPDAHKPGTVGRPLPGVAVRIADDGEVLVRGPNVMLGYLGDPEATAADRTAMIDQLLGALDRATQSGAAVPLRATVAVYATEALLEAGRPL